jgi:hypothetical protein
MADTSFNFEDGAPISASELRKLVEYINKVNAQAISLPSQFGTLADKAIAQKMTAGSVSVPSLSLTAAKEVPIVFTPPLTSVPAGVQLTVETSSVDSEIIVFLKANTATSTGCTAVLTRAANAIGKSITSPGSVKIHYFAIAKSS